MLLGLWEIFLTCTSSSMWITCGCSGGSRPGAIQAFVAVLQVGLDDAKDSAVGILGNIARQGQHVSVLMAAGAIEACVAVLQTGPDDAKNNVAGAMRNISEQEQHDGALVAAGAAEACVAVLQTRRADAKNNAAEAL